MTPSDAWQILRDRTELLCGERSLVAIEQLLRGYELALEIHEIEVDDQSLLLPDDFNDWVAYRLHLYESTPGWRRMIYRKTQTEDEAFFTFFDLVDQYKSRRERLVARINNVRKHYFYTRYDDVDGTLVPGETQKRFYPESIDVVVYTDDPGVFVRAADHRPFPSDGFCPNLDRYLIALGCDKNDLEILNPNWTIDG